MTRWLIRNGCRRRQGRTIACRVRRSGSMQRVLAQRNCIAGGRHWCQPRQLLWLWQCQWEGEKTAPVGSFRANRWGLHDMHGNVWEWVQDCWNPNYEGAPDDGSAWESGDCGYRVLRGGSWFYFPWSLRSSLRFWFTTEDQSNYLFGFRVARDI